MRKIFSLPNLTLLVALALSGVAAYYSIIGLTAIFAGAVLPIVVMGIILEIAKLTTTVWLRSYWTQCGWVLKTYLVPAVIVLAFITSMGIFGFLSKSHLDQGVGSGDVQAQIALIDEKIKTQRENIKTSRDAMAQMDLQVNNVIVKGDTEQSAARSVQIRRQQAKERASLQKEIETANGIIGKLNEERAPISSQLRKVEAEVGPIKYIAAMIYGDTLDANLLEKAVRWVIILLVLVFDPLAIALLLAANQSRVWDKETPEVEEKAVAPLPEAIPELPANIEEQPLSGTLTDPVVAKSAFDAVMTDRPDYFKPVEPDQDQAFRKFDDTELIDLEKNAPEVEPEDPLSLSYDDIHTEFPPIVSEEPEVVENVPSNEELLKVAAETKDDFYKAVYEAIEHEPTKPFTALPNGYVTYEGKHMTEAVLKDKRPDLFVNTPREIRTDFGIAYPLDPIKGDMFVRVDMLPNQVYKFDGESWMQVNKDISSTYLHEVAYIQHLISQVDSGEYDVSLLTENEKEQIEEYLVNRNS